MYTPPAFKEETLSVLHAIIEAASLSTLVTATADGLIATPLPLLLNRGEGPYGTLYGHLARANPQATTPAIGAAMATFMGPDAYVTPSWYASKQEHGKVVPTWNYSAVHAYGEVEFFTDEDRLLDVVTRLTNRHETAHAEPWQVSDAPAAFVKAQLRGIVGLRLPIERLDGKRKFSQNRSAEDREGVAAGLAASARPEDRLVAKEIPV
ncbi:FMN-binding negative transcriptional regulator [Ensifer adhaerens]|uniref:FMN-binding negative transcriptional regulator n=1 Tax=Ensifer adhaerens TaxID=106592 RepID=UPI001CBF3E7A|nr:FMN-binding negative transcriptional regulator [Ensifer adhaerens]MBZ7922317.1 FMN-binding negative transcriptional regulator [Ensifer adhaerens]UAX90954.1 FMN-binding negative transcriptional regulator [Ensifer adhaerens]UAX98583.1 FMN-binding negative transcriptional regulator [Ensifer adhaerens]UAY05964.1 FMN-binding negative transcriptional regulator [Ensifer adhaerens]